MVPAEEGEEVMKELLLLALVVSSAVFLWVVTTTGGHGGSVQEWAHGFKTKHIVATRYSNNMIGYNIGFAFPDAPYNCDGPEIPTFIENHGGNVYQMGGYPGAIVYATFKGVTNKEEANAKLREILPAFENVAARL